MRNNVNYVFKKDYTFEEGKVVKKGTEIKMIMGNIYINGYPLYQNYYFHFLNRLKNQEFCNEYLEEDKLNNNKFL